jgi:hypothetical protein
MVPGPPTGRRGGAPERLASTAALPVPMFALVIVGAADRAGHQGPPPTFMAAAKAGAVIQAKLGSAASSTPLTVADAAARTGLALRDAESGLKWLSTEYRGGLRVTAEGELVHVFPYGFAKPWEGADARRRFFRAVGRGIAGAARFVVRAWVAVVLVGYAAIFLALVVAMAFARQGNDSRREGDFPGGAIASGFLRVVGDALFWTFHPWSPVSVYSYGYGGAWGGWDAPAAQRYGRARRRDPGVPLYERVNRFFFGPAPTPEDPLEAERLILAAIRAGKGRIGLADVMRVTGLPRDRADPLMARLMLDYEGDVGVSAEGGIYYSFPAVRKTASESPASEREPPPAWSKPKALAPLTGNSLGTNLVVAGLNAFNLFMGLWGIANDMTIDRAMHLFDRFPHVVHDTGTPIVLGVVPFVFSTLLFALPIARTALRPFRVKAAAEERGRLAVLREVLERLRKKEPVTDKAVTQAWRVAAGHEPDPKKLNADLVALGGDVPLDEGPGRWRFAELETEAAAVQAEREQAAEDEARLGKVVFES